MEVIKASNTMLGDKIIAGQELVIPGAGMLAENQRQDTPVTLLTLVMAHIFVGCA